MAEPNILASALYYVEKLKYSVIPINKDKKPLIPWQEFQTRIATREEICKWWLKYPFANVGIVTGKLSGLVVIDIDDPLVEDKVQAFLKDTFMMPCCRTPRGGKHLYFRYPGVEVRNTVGLIEKVDLRAEGGYVVAPPSVNGNGKQYTWIEHYKPTECEMPVIPDSFLEVYGQVNGIPNDLYKYLYANKKNAKEIAFKKEYNKESTKEKIAQNMPKACGEAQGEEKTPENTGEKYFSGEKNDNIGQQSDNEMSTNAQKVNKNVDNVVTPEIIEEFPAPTGKAKKQMFVQGSRDDDLFHVANVMVRGGASIEEIMQVMEPLAKQCIPPFPLKEVRDKIISAINRGERRDRSFTFEIKEWIENSSGIFGVSEICQMLQINSREDKKKVSVVLGRLVKDGLIEKIKSRNGFFRKVETDIEVMDYMGAETDEFPLVLPLDIMDMGCIYPGNVIVVAGSKGSGKTAFMLKIIKDNQHFAKNKNDLIYMNSEMGATELKIRLQLHDDMKLKDWNFLPISRGSNWADLITQEKKIWIIDFLDITDNFYMIGTEIKAIHNRLKDGIAIIAIQKQQGRDLGHGKGFSMEKARMYLSLDYDDKEKLNTIKIVDCKAWKGDRNPRGMVRKYKLIKGSRYLPSGYWMEP